MYPPTIFKKVSRNEKAFTLAEVLITAGIIGVVAVLMMPTLFKAASGDSEIIDNTKSSFSRNIDLDAETMDLTTDVESLDLNSCKELVIRKYNNRMKVY